MKYAFLCLPVLVLSVFVPSTGAERPNIVVLFADDMGYSDIGCFGSEIKTPNLDRLAENGLRFSHFYNTGRCCPSRASIMTGLYPHQADIGHMASDAGVRGYRDRLSFNAVTIAEVLGAAGYHTIMTGKWHLGWRDEGCPTARGFQHFYGTRGYIDSYYSIVPRTEIFLNDKMVLPAGEHPVNHLKPDDEWYTTDVFTDYALHFIDEVRQQDDKPFFLYLAYNAPHFPLHAKPDDVQKYRGQYRDGWSTFRKRRYQRLVQLGIVDASWPLSPLDVPKWESLTDAQRDDLDFKMALFAAIVDRLDQNIGRVVDHLDRIGELDNTLLVFLSDNGGTKETGLFGIKGATNTVENHDEWGRKGGWSSSYGQGWANLSNVPFRLYKRFNHEGGISAPMIVHWPRGVKSKGNVTHQVSHLIDIMATCVEVADAKYPREFNGHKVQPMEGKSLVPVLGGQSIGDRALYWEHEGHRAIRDGDWKLVAVNKKPWELYDMSRDRPELNDLSDERPEVASSLATKWEAWAQRANVLPVDEVMRRKSAFRQQQRPAAKPQPPLKITVDPNNLATVATATFSTAQIGRDRRESIQDGVLPGNSADKRTAHRSWWPQKGNWQWVQYDFKVEQTVGKVGVYWFHDHPQGGCKVPERWRLLYRKDDRWLPVATSNDYEVETDQFNQLRFRPITTKSLRMEVWLQQGFSAGIHEWRIAR